MTGYDPSASRYSRVDYDDRNMESSYTDIAKEENRR